MLLHISDYDGGCNDEADDDNDDCDTAAAAIKKKVCYQTHKLGSKGFIARKNDNGCDSFF